jgi:hypothetical protein
MDRLRATIPRRLLAAGLTWAMIVSALAPLIATAQTAASQAAPTCDPFAIDPCPSSTPTASTLSGGFTWAMVSSTVGGGELASTQHWDSTATVDLVWTEDTRSFVPRSGSYAYTHEYTGHCTGSVSGAGVLATEPFVPASSGLATVYAEWSPVVEGALTMKIGIWRDDYDVHCKATSAFPANDYVDPGNIERPLCTRVLASPIGDGSFSISCEEQDIEGVDVSVSGTLVQGG